MNERPWQPVMLNYNYGNPLWGVQTPLGAYLRGEPAAQHPKGELTATHDRDEAQRWADDLNNEARPTYAADTAERNIIGER